MNFLLHFELAWRERQAASTALGAMLPDLWRMAARPARAKRDVRAPDASSPELARVLEGIAHHLEADTWFHREAEFTEGEEVAARALGETGIARMRLFGHVAWEMCLDGALIRSDPHLEARVRDACSHEPTRAAATAAARLHHHAYFATTPEAEGLFHARMQRLLAAVASFELPGGYADAHGVCVRLEGLRAAFGLGRLDPGESARVTRALAALEPLADSATRRLLERREGGRSADHQPHF
ncbi:MAG: hypothetical protein U0271_37510 [Polyangiaceae bacterium]